MRRSAKKTWLLSLVALTCLFLSIGCDATPSAPHTARKPTPTAMATPADITPQNGIPAATLQAYSPARLVIPKMGVNVAIIGLGPDANGAMQAPRNGPPSAPIWNEVFWWNVGALPGQVGNAVIAGHVNRPDASPSTFTNLNTLAPGDTIQVVTTGGHTLTFVVKAKDAPLISEAQGGGSDVIQRVFGPTITANLNLITCWGEWDGKEFDRRLVVYTQLVGQSPFPIPPGTVQVP